MMAKVQCNQIQPWSIHQFGTYEEYLKSMPKQQNQKHQSTNNQSKLNRANIINKKKNKIVKPEASFFVTSESLYNRARGKIKQQCSPEKGSKQSIKYEFRLQKKNLIIKNQQEQMDNQNKLLLIKQSQNLKYLSQLKSKIKFGNKQSAKQNNFARIFFTCGLIKQSDYRQSMTIQSYNSAQQPKQRHSFSQFLMSKQQNSTSKVKPSIQMHINNRHSSLSRKTIDDKVNGLNLKLNSQNLTKYSKKRQSQQNNIAKNNKISTIKQKHPFRNHPKTTFSVQHSPRNVSPYLKIIGRIKPQIIIRLN